MSGLGLMPGDLDIERTSDAGTLVLALRGELDLATVPVLERELDDPASADFDHLLIDLRRVEFMDSTGLACLIRAKDAAEAAGGRLTLRSVGGQIQRLLELTGTIGLFTVED